MDQLLPEWAVRINKLSSLRIPFLFVIDFDQENSHVIPLSETDRECIRFEINPTDHSISGSSKDHLPMEVFPVDFDTYQRGFQKAMEAIRRGDSYLLNLCYSTRLAGISSLESVFESVTAPYKLFFQSRFVVFSPERFVFIKDATIRTFPMKGTIDSSIPGAKEILLNDVKEQEEHATVVDLLRNDLSIVATDVTVERYRYITEVYARGKTLLQCSSEISGKLTPDYLDNLGTILYALLPAGSITGAPKKRTVEWIKDIEPEPRGYYTGVFGLFDGHALDSAVMIRMIEQRPDGFYYRSGGGITYRSVAEQEYKELIDKVYLPL